MEFQFINKKKHIDARKMKNLENQSKMIKNQFEEIEKKLSKE